MMRESCWAMGCWRPPCGGTCSNVSARTPGSWSSCLSPQTDAVNRYSGRGGLVTDGGGKVASPPGGECTEHPKGPQLHLQRCWALRFPSLPPCYALLSTYIPLCLNTLYYRQDSQSGTLTLDLHTPSFSLHSQQYM